MPFKQSRRNFFRSAGTIALSAPFVSRFPFASAQISKFDPDFASAREALRAMQQGLISSSELTGRVYQRIKKHNPKINAFVTLLEEQATARARSADEAQANGRTWGPLHGLPILIKDAFETAGVRTTSGAKELEKNVPREDASAVARLKAAGAIIVGKTNLPLYAGDAQSYNEVAGTTNNPWDFSRTPGGSTGGGAAALASGLGFLELGSDIGGSIRTPCHFCGIYGLKPTLNLVPLRGHIPPPPGVISPEPELPVAGPMSRSAADLLLELQVIGGPGAGESTAYKWNLPSPRGNRLRDYRIGYMLDDKFSPLGSDVRGVLTATVEALRKSGARLTEGWPPGFKPQEAFEVYGPLLSSVMGIGQKKEELDALRKLAADPSQQYAKLWVRGVEMSHREWMGLTEARLSARALWQEYFRTFDAFLMPVTFTPAFLHDQGSNLFLRTIATPEGKRPYLDLIRWISIATLTGCPAAVAPVGKTRSNLPVGIQIMGPYLEDATPIHLAGLFGDVVGGFEVPPGFSG